MESREDMYVGSCLLAAAAAVVLAEEPDQVGPHRVCVTYYNIVSDPPHVFLSSSLRPPPTPRIPSFQVRGYPNEKARRVQPGELNRDGGGYNPLVHRVCVNAREALGDQEQRNHYHGEVWRWWWSGRLEGSHDGGSVCGSGG